ncbi:hypothetical protein QE410_000021 [Microbacterium sp. SORGH_AS 1204]|uniref:PIN-like domain-containing protein n=1 Tax=Microbacterium sp. SORGH_AS_1204 TaxID=3041785 RepID=UPI002792D404|nr:hypothetical protein [Microbacterium sp. SORGH_AS_1204]MDQ1135222.1 hypothetical protein [Microbacterium sp. SORGH_AS_1204]
MKFFLDENFPPLVAEALVAVYGTLHEFASAYSDRARYVSVLDPELMPMVSEAGFHAIVTLDRQQLRRHEERKAIFDARLHWIGLTMNGPAGPDGIAWLTSSLLAALPHLLDHYPSGPQVYRLKGAPNQAGQVMKATPVWNDQLERLYGAG